MWLETLRTTLLITFGILLAVIIFRKVKLRVRKGQLPAVQQMRLVGIEVVYHPTTLRVVLALPEPCKVEPSILDHAYRPLHQWPGAMLAEGEQVLELPLSDQGHGTYYLQVATDTQRTQRRFTIRQA